MSHLAFSLVLASLMAASATITCAQADDPELSPTIRKRYDQSPDLPDGLAFLSTMRFISAISSDDRASGLSFVQNEMGLSQSDADQFLDYLLNTLESAENDHDNLTRRLACPSDRPRPVGDEIYPIFDALADGWVPLATQYLAITKAEIGKEKADRLQQWVESSKLSISNTIVRHKEHYEETGASPDPVLAVICNRLNATQ